MIPAGQGTKGPPAKLLPHQAKFINAVLDSGTKPVVILHAAAGAGKTFALVALAGRLLKLQPNARVLFIVPHAALTSDITRKLGDAGVTALSLDRYRFREMLDTKTSKEFWPLGCVVVVTRSFAQRQDIQASLVEAHWDMLIIDEAHMETEPVSAFYQEISSSVAKVILAGRTPSPGMPYSGVAEEHTQMVVWQRDQMVDYMGVPLHSVSRPHLHEVVYDLTAAELGLKESSDDLIDKLGGHSGIRSMQGMVVLKGLESSPAALERFLLRMQEDYTLSYKSFFSEDQLEIDFVAGGFHEHSLDDSKEQKAVQKILQDLETIYDDSKLNALEALLSGLLKPGISTGKICIATEYVATLFYIAAAIENLETRCHLLHGGMSAADRQQSVEQFSEGEGVLVATRGVMSEGLDFSEVSDLILYDILGGKFSLQQLLGRFDRFGRVRQLQVHVLVPSNIADGLILERLALLREELSAPSST